MVELQLAHEDADKIRAAYNRAEYMSEHKKVMQDYCVFLDKAAKTQKQTGLRPTKQQVKA